MCHYTDMGVCSLNHTTALMKPKYLIYSSKFSQPSFLLFVFSHTHLTGALMFHDTNGREHSERKRPLMVGKWDSEHLSLICLVISLKWSDSTAGQVGGTDLFAQLSSSSLLLLEDIFANGFRMA